jgi:hypothetical protein
MATGLLSFMAFQYIGDEFAGRSIEAYTQFSGRSIEAYTQFSGRSIEAYTQFSGRFIEAYCFLRPEKCL